MRKVFPAAVILLLLGVLPAAAQEQPKAQPRKKRVAILDFEYGTVRSAVAGLFGTDVDVGRGICDLLVKHFVKDGNYSVVERRALDKILAEQKFSTSDRASPASAAKIAKILGLDAIIVGSITQFGSETKQMKFGGAAAARRVAGELLAWFLVGSVAFLGYAHYLVWVRRRGHRAARWILVMNTLLIGYLWYGRVQLWLERWLR